MRRIKKKPDPLSKTTFEPTEKGTWAEFYDWALSEFNEHANYVFDAVNLLLAANIMLTRTIVTETAFVLANCTRWHQWSKRRKIYRTLDELITASDILNSGQGQIVANKAKGEIRLEYSKHILTLFSILNTSLKKQPKKMFDSLLYLGRFALKENHFSDASRVFSRAAEMEKDNSEAWAQLGKARAGADDIQGAFEAYNQALNLDESKGGVWYEKGILWLSKGKRCLSKKEDEASACFTQALDCLKKALDLRQHDHNILIQLGKAHAYKKARTEACEDFAKALLLQNEDKAIKEGYESVEIKGSEIDAAKARLLYDVRDPAQEEDALRCFLVGNYLRVYKKAYEESLRYYERATDLLEKFPHAWYGKGLAYAQIPQSIHLAKQCFERALDQDNKLIWVYYDLGRILQAAGHPYEAIKKYRKAIEIDAQYFDAFYALGLACHEIKDYELAIAYYDRALSIRGNTAYVFFDRGRAKAMRKQHEKAIEDFEEAFRNDPACVRALHHQGLSHAANNNFPTALKNYEDALRLQDSLEKKGPMNMDNYVPKRVLYFNGAESQYMNKNDDDAIEWCKKALDTITQEQPQRAYQGMTQNELKKELLRDKARVEYLLAKCYASKAQFKDACGHLNLAFIIGGEEYINRANTDKKLENFRQDSSFKELVEALHDSARSHAAASVADESLMVNTTPHPTIPTRSHVQ